jgi:hypothetical protein
MSLDEKVNQVMRKLSQHWHENEKQNYLEVLQSEAYRIYMRHYIGQNPYNIFQKKYQERLKDLEIYI